MAEMPVPPMERRASEIDYQPVSGVAVAALVVAFAAVVTAIAVMSKLSIATEWLFPSVVGVAISLAAIVHVRRSEGTRSGRKLATVALIVNVVAGGSTAARLAGNYFVFSNESRNAALDWFEMLKDQKFDRAFVETIPPNRRQGVDPDNEAMLEANFSTNGQLPTFRNCEATRFFQRNGKDVQIQWIGMGVFVWTAAGQIADNRFQLKSAEGVYEVKLSMVGADLDEGGRKWYIANPGEFEIKSRTTYGRLLVEARIEGESFARNWAEKFSHKQFMAAYIDTLREKDRVVVSAQHSALLAAGGGLADALPPGFDQLPIDRRGVVDAKDKDVVIKDLVESNFIKVDGFVTDAKKEILTNVLKSGWIFNVGRTGTRVYELPYIMLTDSELYLSLPVEISLANNAFEIARGRLIAVADSPEFVRELNELKKQGLANPDNAESNNELLLPARTARNWRVARIETNLAIIPSPKKDSGPPGAGGSRKKGP